MFSRASRIKQWIFNAFGLKVFLGGKTHLKKCLSYHRPGIEISQAKSAKGKWKKPGWEWGWVEKRGQSVCRQCNKL